MEDVYSGIVNSIELDYNNEGIFQKETNIDHKVIPNKTERI